MSARLLEWVWDIFSMFPYTWYRCPKCGYESTAGKGGFCKFGRDCAFKLNVDTMQNAQTASRNVVISNAVSFIFIVAFSALLVITTLRRLP